RRAALGRRGGNGRGRRRRAGRGVYGGNAGPDRSGRRGPGRARGLDLGLQLGELAILQLHEPLQVGDVALERGDALLLLAQSGIVRKRPFVARRSRARRSGGGASGRAFRYGARTRKLQLVAARDGRAGLLGLRRDRSFGGLARTAGL